MGASQAKEIVRKRLNRPRKGRFQQNRQQHTLQPPERRSPGYALIGLEIGLRLGERIACNSLPHREKNATESSCS